ncbi:hypothetical protein MMC29_007146 [Sticta canariensis]|nr:hypothetical protein [Sticta canariensis]
MTSSSTMHQNVRDPNTLSNYDKFRTIHTTANFTIDFKKKNLVGNILLKLKPVTRTERREVFLDTNHLDIHDVQVDGYSSKWDLLSATGLYGRALKISLDEGVERTGSFEINVSNWVFFTIDIKLQTTKDSTALQWLTPAQTSNKKHPFMFSQCQAIHARTIFPCQDTPDVKSTYEFNLRSDLPVIASGLFTGTKDFQPGKAGRPGTLLYTFKQDIPIPSYLFAIASGDIATASIGPRSAVATGPEEIQDAKWELEVDTERFIQAAEDIVYPYAWTTYNVLILPPSFPYGGMENPVFTFATPTIISGDRENVDVIAHELAHSWSGNLVSNASWEHFWLNEGWTTYLERRVLRPGSAVDVWKLKIWCNRHGESHRDFSAIIGWNALSESIAQFGETHEFTKLVTNINGKDPDDAFSSVPYEKGFVFLYYLEKVLGKEKWNKFIPHYFTSFARKSLDSKEFKQNLIDFYSSDPTAAATLESVDWDAWFHAPGFPPKPDFDTSLVDVCYALAAEWESRTSEKNAKFEPQARDIKGWTANQVVVFLERVRGFERPLKKEDSKFMGTEYGFAKTRNVEVLSRYYLVGLKARDEDVYGLTAELLGKVGRMKFVRPLYRELVDVDRPLALRTFERNRDFYHPICRAAVEKDLDLL